MNFVFGTLIGIVAACFTSFSFLPQVRKMWIRKSSSDVSHITMYQMAVGCTLWLIYGIYKVDFVMIMANVVMISLLTIALVLYYRYSLKTNADN